jgi:hypothetical protein
MNSPVGHNGPPAEAGPYAIYRTAKIKTHSQIVASALHMTRERDTPNADPARAHLNRILVGGSDPAADVMRLVPSLGHRDPDSGKMLRRSNSVLAIEILITTSPEWWHTATEAQKIRWEVDSMDWLKAEYGEANLAHFRIHGDETTPHITGYVVPLDPETGALNCRRWLGEKQQLRDQQTSYAACVEHLGLQRGVKGSTATHEAVKRVYGAISARQQDVKIPKPGLLTVSPEKWAAEASAQMLHDLEPTFARAAFADTERTRRKSSDAQATKERGRADRAEKALNEQKALASRMRALSLPDVVDALGLVSSAKEPGHFRGDGFIITLGQGAKLGKWYDHAAEMGRGGAIDLVQHVMDTDFKGALAWLADRFGEGAAVADYTATVHRTAQKQVSRAIAEREPFTPPAEAPEHWQHVRSYLTSVRALPRTYIDRLHELGDLYADARRNAVFVCRDPDTKKIVGAELKGTIERDGERFTGMAPGSRKDLGAFKIGDFAKATTVYIAESAIDAISLFKIRQDEGERGHAVLSMAGHKTDLPLWLSKLKQVIRRVCGYDNDTVGDKAGTKLGADGWEREAPAGKDWNDDLVRLTSQDDGATTTTSETPDEPTTTTPTL